MVLHDRPPARFHRASPSETHELFQRLLPSLSHPTLADFLPPSSPPHSTPLTTVTPPPPDLGSFSGRDALPALRPDRPALVVSSTSWTPDEDFGMLLAALQAYERPARAAEGTPEALPEVLAVVTGKGPLKEKYMGEVGRLQAGHGGGEDGEDGPWRFVRCVSLWLEADDYPLLLGESLAGALLGNDGSLNDGS